MKRYLTTDDLVDVIHKVKQRGLGFILSKLNVVGLKRTESTFDQMDYESADWWIIPKVQQRWNKLVSGNHEVDYKQYLVEEFLNDKKGLRMLSLGSGSSHHEMELAKYPNFKEVVCVDITPNRLLEAETRAKELGLSNMKFICDDVYKLDLEREYFDIVFFHSSLHHFDKIDKFVETTIKGYLKPKGILVIDEFVGATRLQFPKEQLAAINQAINLIPKKYRGRYKSNLLKRKYHGSGLIRMILADPSECVDSSRILPAIHKNFEKVVERPYGGNILMSALKDIAHHFVEQDVEKNQVLNALFELEDQYIEKNPSDFVFGVYRKPLPVS